MSLFSITFPSSFERTNNHTYESDTFEMLTTLVNSLFSHFLKNEDFFRVVRLACNRCTVKAVCTNSDKTGEA